MFFSTKQKLHCYAGTFHDPQVFYLKSKPKLLLLSAWLAGHPLWVPEWKWGRPELSYFQVSMNFPTSQSAENWFDYQDFGRQFFRIQQDVGESTAFGLAMVMALAEMNGIRSRPTITSFSSSFLVGFRQVGGFVFCDYDKSIQTKYFYLKPRIQFLWIEIKINTFVLWVSFFSWLCLMRFMCTLETIRY